MVANGGLNISAAGTHLKIQIDNAILAITSRCNYKCRHCYEHFNLSDTDAVPVSVWKKVISDLQQTGVSIITLSGGEPMLRFDELLEMLSSSDRSLSDFHIHTSGYGVTPDKAAALKKAGLQAAGIGLDDVSTERHDAFRGFDGAYEQAVKAIRYFREAGVFTYVNTCVTKELIRSGDLYSYLRLLKELNVGLARWLEPRPCGAYLDGDESAFLDEEESKILTGLYFKLNTSAEYKDHPLIIYEAWSEAPENMGCMMAGLSIIHIDSRGNVEPCVFVPITFGNIMEENFSDIFKRMRASVPSPLHTKCPSVQLNQKIRKMKETGISLPVPFYKMEEDFISLVHEAE
jgi:MoaA/NifB/PqqE/SkfB family radical SAM enzyme